MVIIETAKARENFLDQYEWITDSNSKTVVPKWTIQELIRLAVNLNLSTLCVKLAIDAKQVVAHLDPKPLDIKKTEECLKYLSKDKDAAVVAVVAQSEAVFVNFAYHAAKDHPELIDQLDEFVNGFRKHVHNCLITKLSK